MGVTHPYQPMVEKPAATEAQVQAMHERLAARVRGGGGVHEEPNGAQSPPSSTASASSDSKAGQSPKEKSRLEWNKPTSKTDTALKTKCGRYSCCRVTVNNQLHYELWKLAPGAAWFTRIDKGQGLGSFLQAQVLAQQDADK